MEINMLHMVSKVGSTVNLGLITLLTNKETKNVDLNVKQDVHPNDYLQETWTPRILLPD